MKSGLRNQLSVRLNQEAYQAIQTSGQRPANWLRQAVEWRIENERQALSALTTLEHRIEALERQVDKNQQGILKLQQSGAMTQATLVELQKQLFDLERTLSDAFNTLGSTLLVSLSQQLHQQWQAVARVKPESPPFDLPPAPPRTKL